MFLESTRNIRRKVLVFGIILIAAPVTVLGVVGWAILHRIDQAAAVDATHPSSTNLTRLTQNLADVCHSYHQDGIDRLKRGAVILETSAGQIQLDESQQIAWQAKNELTGAVAAVRLPVMRAGALKLEPLTDFEQPAPVVDEITKVEGTPATIFERMNESGDMLRIASSLKAGDGGRAVGSYIPANGEGETTSALKDVLLSRPHIGKEQLENISYVTLYQPLKDDKGSIVGMLLTALPEEQIRDRVRNLLISRNVELGEMFIVEASGERRGNALVMGNKALEGVDLWYEKDPAGKSYVQEMCARALQLTEGEVAEYRYMRSARAGGIPKMMTARFAYVAELDWLVGFTQSESERLASASPLQLLASWAVWFFLGVGVVVTGLAARIWIKFSDDFSYALNSLFTPLRKETKQLAEIAAALSDETSRALSIGTNTARREQNQPERLPSEHNDLLDKAAQTIGEMRLALEHIAASGESLANITGAIDEITSAGNLILANEAIQSPSAASNHPLTDFAERLRALTEQCHNAAKLTRSEIEQTRTELEKGNLDVLQLMRGLRNAAPTSPAGAAPGDAAALAMRLQTDTLLRLAKELQSAVEIISTDLGIETD